MAAAMLAVLVLLGLGAQAHPAAAVGPFPDYTAPRTTNMSACPAVAVVGFRGSGEAFDDGGLGLGGSIKPMYSELVRSLAPMSVGTSAVSYPAIPFVVSQGEWWQRLDLKAMTAANIASMLLSSSYSDSVLTGQNDGASDLTHLSVRCPSTKIVVTGFSQGAHAARLALARVSSSTAARVSAIVLMGDAGFVWNEPGVTVTGGSGLGTGIAWSKSVPIPPLYSRYAGRVLSACHNNDPVCRPVYSTGFSGHDYSADANSLAAWVKNKLYPPATPPPPPPAPPSVPAAGNCVGFVSDVTVPDGTRVAASTTFVKTWRLRNCGSASWSGLTAVRTSGAFGPASFAVAQAGSGTLVDIGTAMLAPASPGTYRSTYRMRTAGGVLTGDSFWAQVVVPAPEPPCEQFVADVTLPDGSTAQAGSTTTKTWRLRNCGTTAWTGVTARRIFGSYGPDSFVVPAAPSGATVDVSVGLTVPLTEGVQRATYRLQDAAGRDAANSFWVEVTVPRVPQPGRQGVVSYDRMTGGAPYHAYFTSAYQSFTAASNRITSLGATVGNPMLPPGQPAPANLALRLCTDPTCTQVLAERAPQINNYGPTVTDIGDVPVTRGSIYYLVWSQPVAVNGTSWVTYWWAGGSTVGQSDQMQAVVQGFDYLPLGDLNGDGFVGCADKDLLLTHWNRTPATVADGDLNGDLIVNVSDLSLLLARWAPAPGDTC